MRWPYFTLMGVCITLFALSGLVISRFSPALAIVAAVVALAIPPIAVIVANAGREGGRRSNDPRDSSRD
jgi:DUF3099 family protein